MENNKALDFMEKYYFLFDFERNNSHMKLIKTSMENWYYSFYVTCIYLASVHAGIRYMKSRPPFSLNSALFLWNVCMAVISVLGFTRTFPDLFFTTKDRGFTAALCEMTQASVNNPPLLFWVWMFSVCKVIELGDTAFLVLRKRKVVFLHVFHHSSSVFTCWYLLGQEAVMGRLFAVMNYGVHAFLYTYYAVHSMSKKVPVWISVILTTLQIVQTVIGCLGIWRVFVVKLNRQPCHVTDGALFAAFFVYLAHFVLFVRLFYIMYLSPTRRTLKQKHQ